MIMDILTYLRIKQTQLYSLRWDANHRLRAENVIKYLALQRSRTRFPLAQVVTSCPFTNSATQVDYWPNCAVVFQFYVFKIFFILISTTVS